MKGQGTAKNTEKAIYWFTRAAESGDTSAQKILGALYLSGHEDIAKDTLKARYWLQKAADQDDSDALELLKQID